MSKNAELPHYRHFTVDADHAVGQDVEDDKNESTLAEPPPAQSMTEEDAERVRALSDAAVEQRKEEREAAKEEREARANERAEGKLPKPSEQLERQQGAGTTAAERKSRKTEKSNK